jgi:hypothetical protein
VGIETTTSKRSAAVLLLLALVLGLAVAPARVGAVGASDPRSERERVRQEKAAVAAKLDAARADDAAVTQALADLSANVRGEEAMLQDAQRALEQANAAVDAARAEEQRTEQEIATLESSLRALAVDAYIHGGNEEQLATLSADDINTAVHRQALLSFRAGQDADLADQLRAAREDLQIKRAAAEAAAQEADSRRTEIADRLQQLQAAKAQQQQFAVAVDQRIESALAESAALDVLDKTLSNQIAAQQAAIAARNAAASRAATSAAPRHLGGGVTIVSVRGIQVNASIADQVAGLLDAADAAGFSLSGGGYRNPSAQIALRRAHCGTSDYAIYDMPPSQCHPPTARPGTSMHEQGLAIDFTWNGSLITSRGSAAFQWLAANAPSFGLHNLPSEPWHWSTNGE